VTSAADCRWFLLSFLGSKHDDNFFRTYPDNIQQTTMVLRTRIGPDGSIISDGGDDSSSSGGGGSGGGGGGRRRLCPTSVDTFGFHLEPKHFAIVLLLVSVTMGPIGSELFVVFF